MEQQLRAVPGTYYLGATKIQSKPEGVVHLYGTQNLAGSAATWWNVCKMSFVGITPHLNKEFADLNPT